MAFKVKDKMINNVSQIAESSDLLEAKKNYKIEFIKIEDLVPSQKNFYNLSNIDGLAEDIKINGLNDNLLVRPLDNGKFELIGGHRRYTAITKLIKEGDTRFNLVPCQIRELNDLDMEIQLITDNANQRERTEIEKMREVETLTKLYQLKKERGEKVGIIRKRIAEDIGLSESQVQRYTSVNNKLIDELRTFLDEGKINVSSANEFSKLSQESQKSLVEVIKNKMELTKSEAENLREKFRNLEKEKEREKEEINQRLENIKVQLEKQNYEELKKKDEELKSVVNENSQLKNSMNREKQSLEQELQEQLEKELENKKMQLEKSLEERYLNKFNSLQDSINKESEEKSQYKEELEKLKLKQQEENENIEEIKNNITILGQLRNINEAVSRLNFNLIDTVENDYRLSEECKKQFKKFIDSVEIIKKMI